MLDGRRREDWIHTTHMLVTMANSFRTGGHALTFESVYPYAEKREAADAPDDIDAAREAWLKLSAQRS